MDENTFWTWIITGLGGAVNMVERALALGTKGYAERADELEAIAVRIRDAADKLRARPQ